MNGIETERTNFSLIGTEIRT